MRFPRDPRPDGYGRIRVSHVILDDDARPAFSGFRADRRVQIHPDDVPPLEVGRHQTFSPSTGSNSRQVLTFSLALAWYPCLSCSSSFSRSFLAICSSTASLMNRLMVVPFSSV